MPNARCPRMSPVQVHFPLLRLASGAPAAGWGWGWGGTSRRAPAMATGGNPALNLGAAGGLPVPGGLRVMLPAGADVSKRPCFAYGPQNWAVNAAAGVPSSLR